MGAVPAPGVPARHRSARGRRSGRSAPWPPQPGCAQRAADPAEPRRPLCRHPRRGGVAVDRAARAHRRSVPGPRSPGYSRTVREVPGHDLGQRADPARWAVLRRGLVLPNPAPVVQAEHRRRLHGEVPADGWTPRAGTPPSTLGELRRGGPRGLARASGRTTSRERRPPRCAPGPPGARGPSRRQPHWPTGRS